MPSLQRDPDYDPEVDYDFRTEVVAQTCARYEAAGFSLDVRLQDLCERFILGELSEDAFKLEIVRPYLH